MDVLDNVARSGQPPRPQHVLTENVAVLCIGKQLRALHTLPDWRVAAASEVLADLTARISLCAPHCLV